MRFFFADFFFFSENCKYEIADNKLHEAGYDAYLTGVCYIKMLHFVEKLNSTSKKAVIDTYSNKLESEKLF